MISTFIERYRNDGLTIRQIASSLVKQFDGMTPYRASLIARTETHNATSYAHNAYYRKVQEDTGQKMVKKWVAVSDARTRSNHALANGQIVDMDEDFIVGGTRMGYAGDPRGGIANTINCRCVIVYGDERDITWFFLYIPNIVVFSTISYHIWNYLRFFIGTNFKGAIYDIFI